MTMTPIAELPATRTPIEPVLAVFALLLGMAVVRAAFARSHCGSNRAASRWPSRLRSVRLQGAWHRACAKAGVAAMAASDVAFLALVTPRRRLSSRSPRARRSSPSPSSSTLSSAALLRGTRWRARDGAHPAGFDPAESCPALDADAADVPPPPRAIPSPPGA